MKNIFLSIMTAFALTACGNSMTGTDAGSTTPTTPDDGETAPLITPPTISCGSVDCFTGASSLALKSEVSAMSGNAGYYSSFLPEAYGNWKTWVSTLRTDFDIMNAFLKGQG